MLRFEDPIIFMFFCISLVCGDIYFHNIRGSNNRLNEDRFNRVNDKRLFDSQNNDRGGYNVGSTYYYHGSQVELEWTNQHSCGTTNNNCNIVIQYMCDPLIRDGETTKTIPADEDGELNSQYGRHEGIDHYWRCATRLRNKRLFTADQKLKKDTASYTRQNAGGTRYGLECAEERDYYPYWHHSPWRDIAVLTNNTEMCSYYKSESQNVKSRWECMFTQDQLKELYTKRKIIPNSKAQCEVERPLGFQGNWTRIPSHGIDSPECRQVQYTRDNHLGHSNNLRTPRYTFTVPKVESDNCVLRIRYNISTNDYDPWKTDSTFNADRGKKATKVDLASQYQLSPKEAAERGYTFNGNPNVQIFKDTKFKLELAINTAQYGRTFQDRSHVIGFKPRPDNVPSGKIHNINVRGKRGNIVQVYPAVEYDFVPNNLKMSVGDFVHFQWTGSDNNPAEAAGNGQAKTDRSNVVQLTSQNYAESNQKSFGLEEKFGYYGNNYPEHLNSSQFLGLSLNNLRNLAFLSNVQYGGLMSQLNDASPYFDLPLQKVLKPGTFFYMSTRNNDFTNRDQKAAIHVYPFPVSSKLIGSEGGHIAISDRVEMSVAERTLCKVHNFEFEVWPREVGDKRAKKHGRHVAGGRDYASDYIIIRPFIKYCINSGKQIFVTMVTDKDDSDVSVYRTHPDTFSSWTQVESNHSNRKVTFPLTQGGAYVVRYNHDRNVGLIVGVVIAVTVILIIVGTFFYFRRHPNKKFMVLDQVRKMKKGTQSRV